MLTVDGNASNSFSDTFDPALGDYVTLTVAYADLHPDSPMAGDTDLSALAIGDQIDHETTSSPGGYAVTVASDGEVTLAGVGTDTTPQTVDYAIVDASDTYARGTEGTWTIPTAGS